MWLTNVGRTLCMVRKHELFIGRTMLVEGNDVRGHESHESAALSRGDHRTHQAQQVLREAHLQTSAIALRVLQGTLRQRDEAENPISNENQQEGSVGGKLSVGGFFPLFFSVVTMLMPFALGSIRYV